MRKITCSLLAGASGLFLASGAHAQDAPVTTNSANDEVAAQAANRTANEGEIIVTARRKDESLQDVPLTVAAVTSEKIEKLNLLQFEDIEKVVSGITLQGGSGFQNFAITRGVTFSPQTGAAATVATYINEAPTSSNLLFQGIYDVGQFEVLKGPQGTLRGISAPSGSITLTTRKPNLYDYGATFYGSVTNRSAYNAQLAANLPIIRDVLAVRIAGLFDQTDSSGVRSANSDDDPFNWTKSFRASMRFAPADSFEVNLMYQGLWRRDRGFGSALFGPGSAPGTVDSNGNVVTTGPATQSYRPTLRIGEDLSVQDGRSFSETEVQIFVGQADWRFWGQKLSYVGSWQLLSLQGIPGGDVDTLNYLPNRIVPTSFADQKQWTVTHEVRLASEERIGGVLDYTVGLFYRRENPVNHLQQGLSFATGAFGPPGATPDPTQAPNYDFSSLQEFRTSNLKIERSAFFNLTGHFDNLELSFGGRYISATADRLVQVFGTEGYTATATPSGSCLAAPQTRTGSAATYPGFTDCYTAARLLSTLAPPLKKSSAFIYVASASYKITPDIMVYFTHGTSWRQGASNIGVTNGKNRPEINDLILYDDEKSKSYELGLKTSFLNGRGRFNIAGYRQDFEGLILYTQPGGYYVSDNGFTTPRVSSYNFTVNAPARVWGVDVDFGFDVTEHWNIGGSFSWSDGKLKNATVPCADIDGDGVPEGGSTSSVTAADFITNHGGSYVAMCNLSSTSTIAPAWNFKLNSEYNHPIGTNAEAFVRGLLSYQPSNPNTNPAYKVPGYALVDLFVGVRDAQRKWEVTGFVKNLFDNRTVLSRSNSPSQSGLDQLFGNSSQGGYYTYSAVDPREFGLNIRYVFGGG
jgi:iron complex outermembrane receptor protein